MQMFIQNLIIGLSVGATYALIALGYTMVYGVLRLINFAHGDVYMVGAVAGLYLTAALAGTSLPAWAAFPLVLVGSMVICGVAGFLIERLAYRPLRERPRLVVLITAIGVSLLLENVCMMVYGPSPRRYPALLSSGSVISFHLGRMPLQISMLDLMSLALSVALMLVLTWIVLRTRIGLALRAVSYRFDTAMLMGINTNRVISFTFVLGSVLAAVAGVFDGVRYSVEPYMGILPGLKAFIAAVLGGIGSIPGALLGGLLMGLIETMLKGYLQSQYTGYTNAAAFVILILILLIKPEGLLGRPTAEKV